ncbi:FAD-binding oxidoreductase [Cryptosporangium phraense]|uniref:FAD-binding oxidoreductase n=2 Tax=Cryptosporangium phraense TaxID=2593070 RepID=A0A545B0N9_9ACTN|nr:FAD-binding oxidoreductase [Cryptosporangium phraense]
MSPVLQEKLPPGRYTAQLVVAPESAEDVPRILTAAYETGVPITPRGAGTGNYGQATPFAGGAVLDLRRCNRVLEVGDGFVRVEPGAKLTDVDAAVRAAGQDLWMFPSTKGSTAGGFVGGGSAGTGTIEHGTTYDGYVRSLTVAPCDGSSSTFTADGVEALPYVHAYGVTGILTSLTLATEPARDWRAVYLAADDYTTGTTILRGLRAFGPRLASMDEVPLVAHLPSSYVDRDRISVRAILPADTVTEACDLAYDLGGTVSAVVEGVEATDLLSGMSYNHPVYFLQQSGYRCFHLESAGDPLWQAPDAIRSLLPHVLFHLELGHRGVQAMIVADYVDEEQVLAGIEGLEAMGVAVHSPHQWYVDRQLPVIRAVAPRVDPRGLLNPGKLA